jgi:hypothetical protein
VQNTELRGEHDADRLPAPAYCVWTCGGGGVDLVAAAWIPAETQAAGGLSGGAR